MYAAQAGLRSAISLVTAPLDAPTARRPSFQLLTTRDRGIGAGVGATSPSSVRNIERSLSHMPFEGTAHGRPANYAAFRSAPLIPCVGHLGHCHNRIGDFSGKLKERVVEGA